MSVRSALATTLGTVTYDGETATVFDYYSTDLSLDNVESAVFTGLGVFIGDCNTEAEYYCHGWEKVTAEYDVWLADKRSSQQSSFEDYVSDLGAALPPSNLGGLAGNILSVSVINTEPVEHPITALWYQPITIRVVHLRAITLGSEFRINAEPPTCELYETTCDDWVNNTVAPTVDVYANFTAGSGDVTYGYLMITTDVSTKSMCSIYDVQSGDNKATFTLPLNTIFESGDELTFTAIIIDSNGLSSTDTYVVTFP